MNAILAIVALTSPVWLLLATAAIDRYAPFLDRLADTIFGDDR